MGNQAQIKLREAVRHVTYARRKRLDRFREFETALQADILKHVSRKIACFLVRRMSLKELDAVLSFYDPDQVVRMLRCLPKRRHESLIKKMNRRVQSQVELLMNFSSHTAAGMMSVDYVLVDPDSHFKEVFARVKEHERKTGRVPTVLVEEHNVLLGGLRFVDIAIEAGRKKIGKFIKKVPTISYDANSAQVIAKFEHNPHKQVVVMGDEGQILGVIYSDDIIRLLRAQRASDLYDFANVDPEEDPLDPWWKKVSYRWPWLVINLGTGFLAAAVVSAFQDTIQAFVLLAVYMPIVAGMGGNAGTQSLVVTVRGIALRVVELKTGFRLIMREVMAGAVNGLIVGVIATAIAVIWNKSPMFGLVLGVSVVLNLMIAGFFGAFVPLLMKRLGKDPATSATIFITTATDVFGFLAFLGLASAIL